MLIHNCLHPVNSLLIRQNLSYLKFQRDRCGNSGARSLWLTVALGVAAQGNGRGVRRPFRLAAHLAKLSITFPLRILEKNRACQCKESRSLNTHASWTMPDVRIT